MNKSIFVLPLCPPMSAIRWSVCTRNCWVYTTGWQWVSLDRKGASALSVQRRTVFVRDVTVLTKRVHGLCDGHERSARRARESEHRMTSLRLSSSSATYLRPLLARQSRNLSLTPRRLFPVSRMSSKETANEPAAKRQKKEDYVLYYVRSCHV